jgi:hypothetical protein
MRLCGGGIVDRVPVAGRLLVDRCGAVQRGNRVLMSDAESFRTSKLGTVSLPARVIGTRGGVGNAVTRGCLRPARQRLRPRQEASSREERLLDRARAC